MTFQGAVIREQGVTFAVVIVRSHVVDNKSEANDLIASFRSGFGFIPIILMAQDHRGTATYYGRHDIAKFLASISIARIPWKEYTIS